MDMLDMVDIFMSRTFLVQFGLVFSGRHPDDDALPLVGHQMCTFLHWTAFFEWVGLVYTGIFKNSVITGFLWNCRAAQTKLQNDKFPVKAQEKIMRQICWHQVPSSIPSITILSFFPTMNQQGRRKRWWDKKREGGTYETWRLMFSSLEEAGYHWHTSFFQVPFNLDPLLLFIYPLHSLRDLFHLLKGSAFVYLPFALIEISFLSLKRSGLTTFSFPLFIFVKTNNLCLHRMVHSFSKKNIPGEVFFNSNITFDFYFGTKIQSQILSKYLRQIERHFKDELQLEHSIKLSNLRHKIIFKCLIKYFFFSFIWGSAIIMIFSPPDLDVLDKEWKVIIGRRDCLISPLLSANNKCPGGPDR